SSPPWHLLAQSRTLRPAGGHRRRHGRRGRARRPRQPAEPAGQIPVARAEQLHHGGQEQGPDDGGVEKYGDSQADAHLLELDHGQRGEGEEDEHHDHGGGGDDPGGGLNTLRHGHLGLAGAVVALPDPAEDEHVVVHGQPEHHHEQEQRQPARHRVHAGEAEQRLPPPPLEQRDDNAVGGGHRQQVEEHGGDRDDQRPERDEQQHERE